MFVGVIVVYYGVIGDDVDGEYIWVMFVDIGIDFGGFVVVLGCIVVVMICVD